MVVKSINLINFLNLIVKFTVFSAEAKINHESYDEPNAEIYPVPNA